MEIQLVAAIFRTRKHLTRIILSRLDEVYVVGILNVNSTLEERQWQNSWHCLLVWCDQGHLESQE